MDLGHILERLLDGGLLVHGAPAQRVLAPGVRGQQRASLDLVIAERRIADAPDGQVGDGGAADDAVLRLPEAVARLEEDLGRGVVAQLADGLLLLAREARPMTSMSRSTEKGSAQMA